MNQPTRLLIVHGDSLIRQQLTEQLGESKSSEVVAVARNCRTAEPKLVTYAPEAIVLDFTTNPSEALALVDDCRQQGKVLRIIAVADDRLTKEALQSAAGHANHVIVKQPAEQPSEQQLIELGQQIEAALQRSGFIHVGAAPNRQPEAALHSSTVTRSRPTATVRAIKPMKVQTPLVVGIGVSTGGPAALAAMLPELPADFPLPVFIVQHMPGEFTKSMADSLNQACSLNVREAVDGEVVDGGVVLVAPGGKHMRVHREANGCRVELTMDAPECSCRPSVDYLFRSLGEAFGSRVLSVVLTGMGEDGWQSTQELDQRGGCVLAQEEQSCTVYGMPRGPIENGVAQAVPLHEMANAIVENARSLVCS